MLTMTIENKNQELELKVNRRLDAAEVYVELGLAKSEKEVLEATNVFSWKDVGESKIPFEHFYSWITNHRDYVFAPRTGHIGGSWEAIAQGGGGSVAFNRGVTELGLGYPLLFDTNMTPGGGMGDNLYYPGAVLEKGQIIDLPKYVLRNGRFHAVQGEALYSPFVVANTREGLMAINQIHRLRLRNLQNAIYSSDVLYENWDHLEYNIRNVIQRALLDSDPFQRKKTLSKVFDRWVDVSGVVTKSNFSVGDNGVTENGKYYSWDDLLAGLKINLYIASHPEKFVELARSLPAKMPLMGKEFLMLTFALLDTDFTQGIKSQGKINPHFHWGGLQMAGVGRDRGYFQSAVSDLKLLMAHITKGSRETVLPIAYTLMPAGIFQLLPHRNKKTEVAAVNSFLEKISKEPQDKPSKNKSLDYAGRVVDDFLIRGLHKDLSPAFLSRFSQNSHPMENIPDDPALVLPETFYKLNLSQLSIAAGVFKSKISEIL